MPRARAEIAWGGKETLARCIKNGECWVEELNGTEFVSWRIQNGNNKKYKHGACKKKPSTLERVVAATLDEAKLLWKYSASSPITRNALKEHGIVFGRLRTTMSKVVAAMEKALCFSEKKCICMRTIKEAGKLSLEGTDLLRTLYNDIKARLHHACCYRIC